MIFRRLLATVILLTACFESRAEGPDYVALVVGVSDYGEDRDAREAQDFIVPAKLDNAVRDADLIGDALVDAGFEVTRVLNPKKRELRSAVNALFEKLRVAGDDAVGLFYFAGHGSQGQPPDERDVDNFLIPIGADLQTEIDLADEALGLSLVSAKLSSASSARVVIILDACRNFALPLRTRSGFTPRGLAEARASPNTAIAYATTPGGVASDGPRGGNGPYAKALAKELRAARNRPLDDIFREVGRSVYQATNERQLPWVATSFFYKPIHIRPDPENATRPEPVQAPASPFHDCPHCPEMVVIPGGGFLMGSADGEPGRSRNEGPQRRVEIRSFALGKYEVTFADWRTCIEGGGCSHQPEMGAGETDRHPVSNVSWHDVRGYVAWLSAETGETYRLPSEAEWEYATRGGENARFFWGDDVAQACDYANGYDQTSLKKFDYALNALTCDDGHAGTAPVGSFAPNGFDLHDLSGNVWEWVEDVYHDTYRGAPEDGSAWISGDDAVRVLRGGSWNFIASSLRSAKRDWEEPIFRSNTTGFRVARDLGP
ncbi:MAG: SUMF1/EgtB/PvdO family nonheme iron enzyme [Alphaproteobacteria bacterium]|nr:SUMF1/EgtB/PvdO family nonheme iron enzyme [Alphaproteobacteria bacterium]